jgi:hypothetical protein
VTSLLNNLVLFSRQTDDVLLVARKDENGMLLELRIDSGREFELESTKDGRAIGGGSGSGRRGRRGTNDSKMRVGPKRAVTRRDRTAAAASAG